jgi:hypothetical protein
MWVSIIVATAIGILSTNKRWISILNSRTIHLSRNPWNVMNASENSQPERRWINTFTTRAIRRSTTIMTVLNASENFPIKPR